MKRRVLFLIPALLLGEGAKPLRGKLLPGRKLLVGDKTISLLSDEAVAKVLEDERLIGTELEVEGLAAGEGKFEIDGIHTKPVYTFVNGDRLGVSYWCEICYIRTYSPGKCWCCQEYTKLDPKAPNTPDRKP
jgi:hypothetical protein